MFKLAAGARWNSGRFAELDRGVLGGLALSFCLIGIGVLASGSGLHFFNLGGLLIVLGGTLGATLVHFSLFDIQQARASLRRILLAKSNNPLSRIQYLVSLCQATRRDGFLILDQEAQRVRDPFMRLALEITVDGQKRREIRRILDTDIRTSSDRARRAVQVFETMGNYAPAMGLIGTLIGLVQMLGSLQDPATVGPAMSVALLTTLYGAILSNLILLPLAGKLRNRNEEDALVKSITVEGMLSIAREESPIILEQRLQGFLPIPSDHNKS